MVKEHSRQPPDRAAAASPEGSEHAPWNFLQWLGLGLFCMPFLVIPVTMAVTLLGGPLALVPAIPLAFVGSFIGFALLLVGSTQQRTARRAGRSGTSVPPAAAPGGHGRASGGMRGDHPDSFGPEFASGWAAGRLGGGGGGGEVKPTLRRCDHCGVWNEPMLRSGVAVCSRCSAALEAS